MTQVPGLQGPGVDGRYDHNKPQEQLPTWATNRPWSSKEEMQTTQALQLALASAPEVQQTVQVPLEQVSLFRPRFGYRDRVLGIDDIVDVNEIYQAPPSQFSGGPGGFQGTSRNTNGSVG